MRALLVSILCAACASSVPAPLVIRQGAPNEVIDQVKSAFESAGHTCTIDAHGDAVCDEEDQTTPTMVFRYAKRAPEVGVMFSTTEMNIAKVGSSCERAAAALADARASAPALQVQCENDELVLGIGIPIPELGLTVRELNRTARVALYVITTTLMRIKTEAKRG